MSDNEISSFVDSPGAFYPQDYSLNTLNFLPASGQKINLKSLLVEMSYYEDIYSFSVSGSLTILDAQGFIESLQLTGNEYLEVNFGKIKGASNSTDLLFRVYKIGQRKPLGNMNGEVYTLYYCSEELMLSEQTKISKSYKGDKVSDIVNDILSEKLKVNSNRIEVVEETTGIYDFVVPRTKPFEAISWVSNYARPQGQAIGADMLFFETKNGFNFRSLQSMFKDSVYSTYKYEAKNLDNTTQSFAEKSQQVLEYEINKPYDVLNEINSGTLANRLMSIDPTTRTYRVTDFDYLKYKNQSASLNPGGVSNNLKNRFGQKPNEAYEGNLKLVVGNANQGKVGYLAAQEDGISKDVFIETFVPNRTAQISLANFTTIKASIPGDPGITAGRTIQFNLLTLKPSTTKKELDRIYSGKYLVTAVRHIIQPQGSYVTILELAKDSSSTSLMQVNNDSSEWKEAVSD
jgi:hypothetical protein